MSSIIKLFVLLYPKKYLEICSDLLYEYMRYCVVPPHRFSSSRNIFSLRASQSISLKVVVLLLLLLVVVVSVVILCKNVSIRINKHLEGRWRI